MMASTGVELVIFMPDDGKLSYSQAEFIINELNIVEKFNDNEENTRKIKIDLYDSLGKESKYDITSKEDIKMLKDKIKSEVTHNIIPSSKTEKIIGDTLSDEEIKNNILSNLNINNVHSVSDLHSLLGDCFDYYQDSYYKNIFLGLFPNYLNIKGLYYLLYELGVLDEKIENATLENIEEKTYNIIKSSFKNVKTFSDLIRQVNIINLYKNNNLIEKLPNFELLLKLCENIDDKDSQTLDKLLEGTHSYEDIIKVITQFSQNEIRNDLLEKQDELKKYNNSLEEIKIAKNIIASKNHLNELIDNRKEKHKMRNEYIFKLEENNSEITSEKNHQESINKLIKETSSNFIKRFIYRKRIKQYKQDLQESINKVESLKKDNQNIAVNIDSLTTEIKSIETEFKSITQFDYVPDSTSAMDNYYQRDITEHEKITLENIERLNKDINNLNKTLEEIDKSNILNNN